MKKFLFSGIIACLIGFCLSCTTTEDSVGLQMRAGLPNFNYKIQKNEPVSVVFFGWKYNKSFKDIECKLLIGSSNNIVMYSLRQ